MKNWIKNHECNDICDKFNMSRDEALIEKLKTYIEKFKTKEINNIMF